MRVHADRVVRHGVRFGEACELEWQMVWNPVQASSRIGIHDAGDVNGDAIDDLVIQGAGKGLSVIFGKSTPFGTGSFASIDEFADGAISFPDSAKGARVGDVNQD